MSHNKKQESVQIMVGICQKVTDMDLKINKDRQIICH